MVLCPLVSLPGVAMVTRLRAVHPLTGEELPVVVSEAVQYDEYNDTHMGEG